jgi:predicted lipoprotein with Yx(FWY)xxD motif
MKKEYTLVIVVAILVLGVLGYLGRAQIKSMLGMKPTANLTTTAPATNINPPSDNIYGTKTNTTKGVYLTDFAGMSLYTFDKDTNGVSTCYSDCAMTWPAYTSGAIEGELPQNITMTSRTDGSEQFAWQGKPIYYYIGDKNPGDVNGDGIEGIWHLVKP